MHMYNCFAIQLCIALLINFSLGQYMENTEAASLYEACVMLYGSDSELCQNVSPVIQRSPSFIKKATDKGGKALFVRFGRNINLDEEKIKRKNEFVRFG
ncbi:hypothetical protein T11_11695 [Trichinella zimbabwensis]|uniref:Uncharacterized protein n=1 Tax=Trichinella zimbabwensis TaxID=268475 RepID=A0A0V1I396_9BILA|nr:hypothetical protein T11_11695 [Trichinella zimbabwensis]